MNGLIRRALTARNRPLRIAALEDRGAIDLASIMVGVLVIGIIGAVIAATVFAVIPWSQDQAAQQNLDAIKTAESVQYAKSAADNGKAVYLPDFNGVDASADTLVTKGYLHRRASVSVSVDFFQQAFIAASESSTGTIYYLLSSGQRYTQAAGDSIPTVVQDFATANNSMGIPVPIKP